MLMTPSFKHEKLVTITDDAIKLIAQNMKRSYYRLGSTRITSPISKGTGPESDRSYYLFESTDKFREADDKSETEENEFIKNNGPELVIEIGITSIDNEK